MHPLVPTEVGELSVRFQADFANEGLYAAVYVSVLFKTARSRKCLPTFRTGMRSCTSMLGTNVALQVTWVGESFVTIFAEEGPFIIMVRFLVLHEGRLPGEGHGAVRTLEFPSLSIIIPLTGPAFSLYFLSVFLWWSITSGIFWTWWHISLMFNRGM